MTRAELLQLLGEPSAKSAPARTQRESVIWKYGEVEYHFSRNDDRVWLIYSEDDDGNPIVLGERK